MRNFLAIILLVLVLPLAQVFAAPPSGVITGRPSVTGRPSRIPTNANASGAGEQGRLNRTQNVSTVLDRMVRLAKQRLDRYGEFLAKIQTRIDRLEGQGQDVSKFTQYIALANTNMGLVQTAISGMESAFAGIDTSSDMQTIRRTVQSELRLVREAFTKLHTTMKQVVAEITNQSNQ